MRDLVLKIVTIPSPLVPRRTDKPRLHVRSQLDRSSRTIDRRIGSIFFRLALRSYVYEKRRLSMTDVSSITRLSKRKNVVWIGILHGPVACFLAAILHVARVCGGWGVSGSSDTVPVVWRKARLGALRWVGVWRGTIYRSPYGFRARPGVVLGVSTIAHARNEAITRARIAAAYPARGAR